MKPNLLFIPISVGILLSCNTNENKQNLSNSTILAQQESVIKPIKGLEPETLFFEVEASESSVIDLPNGGKISFPPGAFLKQNGEVISGKVKVAWKEFHSITDLILSGIPMKYDSLGVKYDFVSGGMFSISATQGKENLNLDPTKKAKVDLISIDDTPCHNFYKIDEKTGTWDYLATKNAEAIPGKTDTKAVKTEEKNEYLLDTKPTNLKDFPELDATQIVAWKCLDKISKNDKKIMSRNARKSTLLPGQSPNTYQMEIAIGKEIKKVQVEPYFLKQALKETKKVEEKVEKDFKEIIDYQNSVAAGKTLRSIEISGFGTYNWDYVHQIKNPISVIATFNIPIETNLKLVRFFMVCPESNLQIACLGYENTKLIFDPRKKHCVIGILPDNRLVYVDNSIFVTAAKSNSTQVFDFNFIDSGITLNSGYDLAKELNEFVGS